MKITTKQIQNIIKEELNNLLYEEETDSKLNQFITKLVDDEFIKEYDKAITKQIFTLIDEKLNDKKNPIKDQDGVALLNNDMVRADPKLALQMLKTFYDKFTPEEYQVVEALEDYPLDANLDDRKEKVIDHIIKTKNLSGADLAFKELDKMDLRGFNLSGIFAQRASFYRTDLRGADLTGADLEKTWLLGAVYDDRTKWPAGFDFVNSGAFGPKANLRAQRGQIINYLRDKNFSGLDLREIDLSELRLMFIKLENSNLSGAKMKGAHIRRAKLNNADLSNADLTGSVLWGTDLTGANLNGAILTNALYSDRTIWPEGFDPEAAGAIRKNK